MLLKRTGRFPLASSLAWHSIASWLSSDWGLEALRREVSRVWGGGLGVMTSNTKLVLTLLPNPHIGSNQVRNISANNCVYYIV